MGRDWPTNCLTEVRGNVWRKIEDKLEGLSKGESLYMCEEYSSGCFCNSIYEMLKEPVVGGKYGVDDRNKTYLHSL